MYADLHTHTLASDGTDTAEALAHAAHERRISLLAVADHDTTASVAAARARCEMLGIRLLAGVELSCDGGLGECHMLGLRIDIENPALQSALSDYHHARQTRGERMVARLQELGVAITMADVLAQVPEGNASLGRPHVARALVAVGAVRTYEEAFQKFIGDGGKAHIGKPEPTPEAAIELIHGAGGLAFLAHPIYLKMHQHDTYETRFNALKRAGLDGIEAYYSQHSTAETARFLRLAEKYNLLVSGGSDYHGSIKPDVPLGLIETGKPLPLAKLPAVLRD